MGYDGLWLHINLNRLNQSFSMGTSKLQGRQQGRSEVKGNRKLAVFSNLEQKCF